MKQHLDVYKRQEFLALKWSDIDFESRIVTVNKNLSMVYDLSLIHIWFAVRAVFGRYRAAERVLGRGGKAVGIVLIRGFAAQRVYGFQQLARLGVGMLGRCGC